MVLLIRSQVALHVVDQRLQIVGALLQLPQFLVAARLVVKDAHDQIPINISPAVGHVLQNFFGLAQVNEGQLGMVVDDFDSGFVVELPDGGDKLF